MMEQNHTYTAAMVISEYITAEKAMRGGYNKHQTPNDKGLYHVAYVEEFKSGGRDIAEFFKNHPNIDSAIYVRTKKQAKKTAEEWQRFFDENNGK